MPRRRSGDSRLRQRLRESQGTDLPADLTKYLEFLQGTSKIQVDNPAPDGARELYALYLLPFNRDYDAAGTNTALVVGASGYAMSMWFGTTPRISVTNADGLLGHDLDQADKDAAVAMDGFYPALVRCTVSRSGATATNRTSAKTGRQYSYEPKRTSAMPFGRNKTAPEEDYLERKEAIAQALSQITAANRPSFSFEAEVIRETPVPETEFDAASHSVAVN